MLGRCDATDEERCNFVFSKADRGDGDGVATSPSAIPEVGIEARGGHAWSVSVIETNSWNA
jgi:hypothetical protein